MNELTPDIQLLHAYHEHVDAWALAAVHTYLDI